MTSALLALIAIIGAWIALQQMLIARARLNHDLFERRFAVYNATRTYIVAMLKNQGGTQEDAVKWHEVALTAPFIFEKGISDFLEEVSTRGKSMRARVGDKPIYEVQKYVGEYNDNSMWFYRNFESLEERFQNSMNLFRLSPFSINYALPSWLRTSPRQPVRANQKPLPGPSKVID